MIIRSVRISDRKDPDPDASWEVEVMGSDSDRAAVRHVKRTNPTIRAVWRDAKSWRCPFDVRVVGWVMTDGASVLLPVDDWGAVLDALGDDQDAVARRILGQLPLHDWRWEGLINQYEEKQRSTAMTRGERTVTRDEAVAWLRQREGDTVLLTVFGAEIDNDHYSDEWVSVKGVLLRLSEDHAWLWAIGNVRGSSAWFGLDDSRVECRILDRWASFNVQEVRARLNDVPWEDPAELDAAVERAQRRAVREQLLLKLGPTQIAVERDDDDPDDDDDDNDAAAPDPEPHLTTSPNE